MRIIKLFPIAAVLFIGFSSCDKKDDKDDENISNMYLGHEYVDLGLKVKWATCNVDASKPSEYGEYFIWGNDVAHQKWGGDWRMPTQDDFEELVNNCTYAWITKDGIQGCQFTSNITGFTDRSIFLPAAGKSFEGELEDVGLSSLYWSSTLYSDDPEGAWGLWAEYNTHDVRGINRECSLPIRPVCP